MFRIGGRRLARGRFPQPRALEFLPSSFRRTHFASGGTSSTLAFPPSADTSDWRNHGKWRELRGSLATFLVPEYVQRRRQERSAGFL